MIDIEDLPIREKILDSPGNIAVSASAGTGKTHILVERIMKDVEKNDNYQTVAAITFTNKAANEIKTRLGRNFEGFIGTNDKFIVSEIIEPFAKDLFPYMKELKIISDYTSNAKQNTWTELLENFKQKGVIGTYTDSPQNRKKNFAFELALYIMRNSFAASRYIKCKYFRIYIDEYQDSDKDMHNLFCYLCNELKIKLFVVGDIKQSIYGWRGGFPDGFKQFISNFNDFVLKHNFRSNIQIQNYANIFMPDVRKNYRKATLSGEVQGLRYRNYSSVIDYIKKWLDAKESCAFLFYTNNDANEWAKRLQQEELNFIYIPRAPLDDPQLENEQIWVARGIACYIYRKRYNEYSLYDEIPLQEKFDIDIIKKILKSIKEEFNKTTWNVRLEWLVKELYEYLLDEVDYKRYQIELQKLKETFENKDFAKSYNTEEYDKIVTTIHSTKGLQYKQVIINAENYVNRGNLNEEVHYVAITRPKDKLLVLFSSHQNANIYYQFIEKSICEMKLLDPDIEINDVIDIRNI